jgi:predicted esterase
MVVEGLERWIDDFRREGWTVISPVAPEGGQFMRRHLPLVTEILSAARARHGISDGPVRLFGMSNGGISALEVAARHPDLFTSVTVAPGYLRSTELVGALSSLPVNVVAGERDSGWLERGRALVEGLREEGGRAHLRVVRGEGHEAGLTLEFRELRSYLT